MIEFSLWSIRGGAVHFDPYEEYVDDPTMFSIQVFHGGQFEKKPTLRYVKGKTCYFDRVDSDEFSVMEFNSMFKMLRYPEDEVLYYHYRIPDKPLNEGIRALGTDQDVIDMCQYVRRVKLIEVYVEHWVTKLDTYFMSPPKPTSGVIIEEIDDVQPPSVTNVNRSKPSKPRPCSSRRQLALTWLDVEDGNTDVINHGGGENVNVDGINTDEGAGDGNDDEVAVDGNDDEVAVDGNDDEVAVDGNDDEVAVDGNDDEVAVDMNDDDDEVAVDMNDDDDEGTGDELVFTDDEEDSEDPDYSARTPDDDDDELHMDEDDMVQSANKGKSSNDASNLVDEDDYIVDKDNPIQEYDVDMGSFKPISGTENLNLDEEQADDEQFDETEIDLEDFDSPDDEDDPQVKKDLKKLRKKQRGVSCPFHVGQSFRDKEQIRLLERGRIMMKFVNLVEEHLEEIAALDALDVGKVLSHGKTREVPFAINTLRYYAGAADKIHGKTLKLSNQLQGYTLYEPIGVVGHIIPWNFPVGMLFFKIGPAMAAGCTMVVKPAEQSPLSALYCAHLAKLAGVPDGVINVITGYGPTAGAAISSHMDIDCVSFTGSTEVGRLIMQAAAMSNLKSVSLELGGKSPLIVFDDVDVDSAVNLSLMGGFANKGEYCVCSSRIFVQEGIYDEFVTKIASYTKGLTVGDPFDPSTMQGPQADKAQYEKVLSYIEHGKRQGATLLTGGNPCREKGYYIEPTIFTDVKDDMLIANDEIFGPVMCVFKFKTIEEAIARANSTSYGLAAGIATKDLNIANTVSRSIRAGIIWINCYLAFDADSPYGGYKMSGFGREFGMEALYKYLQVKSVVTPVHNSPWL